MSTDPPPRRQGKPDPRNHGLPHSETARQALISWCKGKRYPDYRTPKRKP